ncbi:malto-oligosyltrehalose synthase [Microbacterium sp. SORGH_AS_0888]|uniref:malto-oligosyltrehalose synthase n=1 Tax=Microbacterium sp. SORGH_AS_0888 TaxID=3041791 RepID=UPI002789183F|nr:malto-oligosyltrehalose synthase [Microbacterium sp. SORGH_AS_0888]MDQ1129430.1 (1->4)-alpha-D-glucan 1-alpha-D-glucosylmutase [Microbacterium sp. SORGH_AS_0888]
MTRLSSSTYRLQIRPALDLQAAAGLVPYLRDLGVGWVYLSPLLRATSGSDHGYDVVDPSCVDPARGGPAGLARLSAAAREAGLGVLVDIVPNHMGVAVPSENPWWWDVLRLGRASRHADAFDIDWDAGGGRVRLPILGAPLADARGDLRVEAPERPHDSDDFVQPDGELASRAHEIGADAVSAAAQDGVLRYFDHVLPLAPGSLDGVSDPTRELGDILARQHYELRFWRDEQAELNYRRFFAVSTLAGVRVERPEVFDQTHSEILRWVREGLVDGLRVDHPDGLVDPGGYLDRLAAATAAARRETESGIGDAAAEGSSDAAGPLPVWVEKILERAATDRPERLRAEWATAGTTGYDAMAEIDRVLIDPAGEPGLDALDARLRSESGLAPYPGWAGLIHHTKRGIADTIQRSEIARLVRCLPAAVREDVGEAAATDALAELLACFPTYRSYLPAGAAWLAEAVDAASLSRPDLAAAIAALVPVLADPSEEAARRFQQTTGPVMAKGVEDTAFYRATRLGTLTEVGGDPGVFALPVAGFHDAFARRQAEWPHALTALSTHDTKRGEDVRARLSVLAELPAEWARVLEDLRAHASTGHGPFDALLWQAIVGAWPATPERLHAYAEKAAREAGERTAWLDVDAEFEARMHALVDAAFEDAKPVVQAFVDRIAGYGWSNSLSAKLLQLVGPGVPDVYQGSELWETSLVDPDNRRAVDFAERARMLRDLDGGSLPPVDASGAAKLLLVSRALRLRRDRPGLFTRYRPLDAVGPASGHVVAFDRGGAIAVATRLPVGLERAGGWRDTAVPLPSPGPWRDELTGAVVPGGLAPLAELLSRYPVALLTHNA